MEERVGKIWHKLITRAAGTEHGDAAVGLDEVRTTAGIMFRALGGDGGLRLEAATATDYGARRNWIQRIAGTNRQAELAWRDADTLCLPWRIAVFPDRALNRDLYLWLAALAAQAVGGNGTWITRNQLASMAVLHRFPGMGKRYRRLVDAHLNLRPEPESLPPDEAVQERAVRNALLEPGSIARLPVASKPPHPVPMWLHPSPPYQLGPTPLQTQEGGNSSGGGVDSREPEEQRRRRAERTDSPEADRGLIAMRMETILSWSEFVKVDRSTDDDDDQDAERVANDMDVMSIARDVKPTKSRLRFDLDLPGEENDDTPLGEGIWLPEWDHKKQLLQTEYACLRPMIAARAEPRTLPNRLRRTARRLRGQFQALVPTRMWFKGQHEGGDVDLDAWMRFTTDRARGRVDADQGLYRDFRGGVRDLACLLLADLSLSTDSWVNNSARVIDVIRDSLFLFAEALATTGDRFAMYGFSSRKRQLVRYNTLKCFDESYSPSVRGRIAAIKPGFYTRMGAAIRHSTSILEKEHASRRLLLILTDGKPNDLDRYEGRYGIEDTRMAILEARRGGLQPFCVTIDEKAGDYLPHLFGTGHFVVIRKPSELPRELPMLYAHLTG